jgi:hypothetical protein
VDEEDTWCILVLRVREFEEGVVVDAFHFYVLFRHIEVVTIAVFDASCEDDVGSDYKL